MKKTKKLLTLDNLIEFCKKEKFYNFSSKDTGYQLAVQVPSVFEIFGAHDDNTLLFCNVKLFHIGPNRNKSSVTEHAAKKALPTIAYKPLLANFCEIDGEKDFTSHDMLWDEDGNIEYLERQIGCFTSDAPTIKYDQETGKKFVFARVAIPREYTDACDIIERKGGTKISVELLVNEMQYSVEDDVLELTDVVVSGATCLGRDPETGEPIEEGMEGAKLGVESFTAKQNSMFGEEYSKIVDLLSNINEKLGQLSYNKFEQKGVEGEMSHFEELLEKYGVSVEEITFEYDGLSDEELDIRFAELFDESESDGDGESEPAVDGEPEVEEPVVDEEPEEAEEPIVDESEIEIEPIVEDGSDEEDDESDDGIPGKKRDEFAVINFRISHEDTRYALQNLLNNQNTEYHYYVVNSVYDDFFYYEDWCSNDAFKQYYKTRKDVISFNGDPIPVYRDFVTAEERTELENMRKNYAALVEFKAQYDAAVLRAEKEKVFNDAAYVELAENEEFKALMEHMDEFSVEEIKVKADLIFAQYAKTQLNFAVATPAETHSVGINLNVKPTKKRAYARLFNE